MAVDHLLGQPHHPIIQDEVLHYKLHLPFIPHHLQVHLPIIAIRNLYCNIWQRLGTFESVMTITWPQDGHNLFQCLYTYTSWFPRIDLTSAADLVHLPSSWRHGFIQLEVKFVFSYHQCDWQCDCRKPQKLKKNKYTKFEADLHCCSIKIEMCPPWRTAFLACAEKLPWSFQNPQTLPAASLT